MNDTQRLQLAFDKGIVFDGAKGFLSDDVLTGIANDAALITTPNSGVPAVMTAYIDPSVVEILTAVRNAREIFGEVKKGDWSNSGALFKAVELTGHTTPYTDYGNGAAADVNISYPYRDNFVYQTHVKYGDREVAVGGRALINLVSEKQRSAANILDVDANRYALQGVEGKQIYGLLNDPNLPAAITPDVVNTDVTAWDGKTTAQIYADILKLAKQLFTNSGGQIDQKSPLVLAVSPATSVVLAKATDYNVSVFDMMQKYFTNLRVVTLPELDAASGDSVMLIATSVNGAPTAQIGYSDKMRAGRIIPHTSWYDQKYVAGTYGTIVYYPMAIARMTGV